MKIFLIGIFFFHAGECFAQSIGIGTTTPNSSAQLDISSNNKGLLIPRLTIGQRDGILSPTEGLMIYNTTDSTFYVFKTRWRKMGISLPYTDTVASSQYGINIVNNGGGSALRGIAGNFTTAISGTAGIFGIGMSGSSIDGGAGVSGQSTGAGSGVAGNSPDPAGTGVFGTSLSGTGAKFNSTFGTALSTTGPVKMNGSIQLQGIGEATGRVLKTDASGNASWGIISRIERISVGAAAFRTEEQQYESDITDGQIRGTSRAALIAPVNLPDGATITNIFFNVMDGNDLVSMTGKLLAFQNGSLASSVIGSFSTGLAFMGGYINGSVPVSHIVNNSLNCYAISIVNVDQNGLPTFWIDVAIESVIITYTINLN